MFATARANWFVATEYKEHVSLTHAHKHAHMHFYILPCMRLFYILYIYIYIYICSLYSVATNQFARAVANLMQLSIKMINHWKKIRHVSDILSSHVCINTYISFAWHLPSWASSSSRISPGLGNYPKKGHSWCRFPVICMVEEFHQLPSNWFYHYHFTYLVPATSSISSSCHLCRWSAPRIPLKSPYFCWFISTIFVKITTFSTSITRKFTLR